MAGVDKGFPRWHNMTNVAGAGDYLVLGLAPHTKESVFLCVD